MASMVDIKRRIKSVKGTQQMTKAMNLVASAKLGRAKSKLASSRPFNKESMRIMSNIAEGGDHPFFKSKDGDTLYIIITSDRGLCGGYNANSIKAAENTIISSQGTDLKNSDWSSIKLYTIGKRCNDYFRKRGRNIIGASLGISEKPEYTDAKAIADTATEAFLNGDVTKVFLVYTYFESIISHEPKVSQLLPIDPSDLKGEDYEKPKVKKDVTIYEPGKEFLLDYLLPKYITTRIYDSLVEGAACEQGARMTSMDNATKNAKEALENMNLIYNRARQAAITQEISEIVGGANAIQGG